MSGFSRVTPGWLLTIVASELAGLILLWIAWEWEWRGFDHQHLTSVLYGVMPLAVPWFGALGGVTNALFSISTHWYRFDSADEQVRLNERLRWSTWTVMQFPLGAVFGMVAVLIVVLLTKTISTAEQDGTTQFTNAGIGICCAVAFTVGFRQRTFEDLLGRVTDVLLGPGGYSASQSFSLDKTQVELSGRFGSPSAPQAVTLSNTGKTRLGVTSSAVALSSDSSPAFTISRPPDVQPGEANEIAVRFDPDRDKEKTPPWTGRLLVTFGDVTRAVELRGTLEDPDEVRLLPRTDTGSSAVPTQSPAPLTDPTQSTGATPSTGSTETSGLPAPPTVPTETGESSANTGSGQPIEATQSTEFAETAGSTETPGFLAPPTGSTANTASESTDSAPPGR